ncbi:Zn(II)2Cys6 transcription factor [Aspergillus stella-maris]|uniref:Zn(II)2Cys6 transcription factor n=1 Tax=Aspergillus stella-maris TaxID=1810926 RepID=UPI003CCCCD9A
MTILGPGMSARRGQSSRKRPMRLPTIAPKDEVAPGAPTTIKAAIVQPRLRFPPRSRTGCWTCRSRKIKCDEVHPQCNQCARLGHVCDYRPRLCFRDDTRRVMERMPDVKTKGNAVWDPVKVPRRRSHYFSSDPVPCDLLPDFSRLTSDEDREKKAQSSAPGTYHVVVVPESFARLPEYTEDTLDTVLGNPYLSPMSEYSHDPMDDVVTSEDPNVVILHQFRDSRKQTYSNRRSYTRSPESDLGSNPVSAPMLYTPVHEVSEDQISESFDLETYDMALFDHFQNVVWTQLIPDAHNYLEANIFEQEASNFPPLLHVMMALSSLSLVRQGNAHYMTALQYYDQALPALQSSLENCDDVLSDGLFLTHFLLLIYQITFTTPSNRSNLWSHHMSRLVQLTLLRQTVVERERYPIIIWLICHVDLFALMSGAGSGEYVRAAIENHLLSDAVSPLNTGPCVMQPGEYDVQPLVVRLYRECIYMAGRLGLIAAKAKTAEGQFLHSEVENLRGSLQQLWNSQEVRFLMENQANLPKRSQYGFHKLSVLFHTALLFSCHNVWPGQGAHIGNDVEKEIQHHTDAILHHSERIIAERRHNGPLFLNFPLFLSGTVTSSNGAKMAALDTLAKLGEAELGYDATTTSTMLQVVCETQMQHMRGGGHLRDTDWIEVAANHGYRIVSYG